MQTCTYSIIAIYVIHIKSQRSETRTYVHNSYIGNSIRAQLLRSGECCECTYLNRVKSKCPPSIQRPAHMGTIATEFSAKVHTRYVKDITFRKIWFRLFFYKIRCMICSIKPIIYYYYSTLHNAHLNCITHSI